MKTRRNVIIILCVVGVLLLAYFAWSSRSGKKFDWSESYDAKKTDKPYGTFFLHELLKDFRPDGKFTFNEKRPIHQLLAEADTATDYVFVGRSLYMDDSDVDTMIAFVERGGEVLIASNELPKNFTDKLYSDTCTRHAGGSNYKEADYARFNFYHDSLKTANGYKFVFHERGEDVPHWWAWGSFDSSCDVSGKVIPLGFQDPGQTNFFKVVVGNGTVYIHKNPIVFTNYFLTQSDKLAYASGVFGHLSKKNIILDDYSKLPLESDQNGYNSPLHFILKQPSLKYAWWLLLATVLLYIVFASKRTQRVIPILEKKVNTSLEFIHLVATLHFQNGNPLDMARKKMRYFLYLVRSKYGIHSSAFSDEQMLLLAEKSKVSLPEIKIIFDQYNNIEQNAYYNTQSEKLVALYNAIENFKIKCK